ncbi:alpha/beta hydrolase family protein [Bowmanella dokdonensis]|uniref:S9 family peptidase n=1 Tax=Bowmanella dokdonensis TaxID=751969 RepID=A0A939IPU1_9ALTE|nr:alpha/beta fold hydrolase [Bowmanella dokdonensis]MBN7826215.1 S9 family peptidase [Bowmanella dokdonensis]
MRIVSSYLFFCFCVFTSINALASTEQDKLPVEAFGNLPALTNVKLSPDGKHLAALRNEGGQTILLGVNLDKMSSRVLAVSDNKEIKFNWYQWANNEYILIGARYPAKRYGVNTTETRLLKVSIHKEDSLEPAFRPRRSKIAGDHFSQFQDNVISLLPAEKDHFLLSVDLDSANRPNVYRLSLNDLGRSILQRSRRDIRHWHADRQGRVRLGEGLDDTKIFYLHKDWKTNEWRTLWEYEIFDAPDIDIMGFDKNPDILYIRALHKGRYAIFRVNLANEALTQELVYADPHYDIEGRLIYSPKSGEVVGVSHGEADNGRIYWDKEYMAFQEALDHALPDSANIIISMSDDERRYVLLTYLEDAPGYYYIGDRDNSTLNPLGSQYPLLDETNLSGNQKVRYQARDGLTIEAYLTLPRNKPQDHPIPAVVLPHGGPMARDYGGFDWLAEFLASRGYLVLQPNFRGSSGYGFDFEQASVKGWGKEMQQDLQDAAHWLVEQKLAIPGRICLVGASYGGYAALMGLATQGDTFSCAASINGVTDLTRILHESRRYTNAKVVRKQLGDDWDELETTSPLYLAGQISAPVLLIHGEEDRVVSVYHSREMAEELQDLEKQVRYVELEKGNHYLELQHNRLTTLRELEAFLAAHL